MTDVPITHPRYHSLLLRDKIVDGVERGITSLHGLIAHGRGEALDYLLGEKSHPFADHAARAAAAMLLLAEHPVLSMNGNVTALVPELSIELAKSISCPLEINIFHASKAREEAMKSALSLDDSVPVLMPESHSTLSFIDSNRKFVNSKGIFKSDCIWVPLEDGDRCEALRKMGKDVITVDLNPLSRTATTASITIVDNVVRAIPLVLKHLTMLRGESAGELRTLLSQYSNEEALHEAQIALRTSTS